MNFAPLPRRRFASRFFPLVAVAAFLASSSSSHATAGASVPVATTPKITQQPVGATVNQGQALTLTVGAIGYPEPTYQWMRNSVNLPGATAAKLVINNAQPADTGSYAVVATNRNGRATSAAVTATVVATNLPTLTLQPVDRTGEIGQTISFQIAASGTPAPTYQWRKNGAALPGATSPTLVLTNLRATDAGSYDAYVTNTRGTVLSRGANLTVLIPITPSASAESEPPVAATPARTRIVSQPRSLSVAPGELAAFMVTAAGENLTFQWNRNGAPLLGATAPAYAMPHPTDADMGFYSVTVSGQGGTVESDLAILIVAASTTSRLANLSTRGFIPPGGALTPGFTWRGTGGKHLLLRAVGPTLAQFGVADILADPRLEVIPAGGNIATLANDQWTDTSDAPALTLATAASGAFALAPASADAALLAKFAPDAPRNHTVRITSANPTAAGIVLAEIYDSDAPTDSGRLTAVSTLGFAGAGERALVPGFTIAGGAPKRLLIRAVGPGLKSFGVGDALSDPRFSLHAAGLEGPIASNDDWSGQPAVTAAATTVGAFPLESGSRDAALVISLPPGSYTIVVGGSEGSTGLTLVEIYDLDP